MSKYSICGFVEFETVHGTLGEEALPPIPAQRHDQAEKLAKALYDEGKCTSIYIQSLQGGYWNPARGIEANGKNWVKHFNAIKEEK